MVILLRISLFIISLLSISQLQILGNNFKFLSSICIFSIEIIAFSLLFASTSNFKLKGRLSHIIKWWIIFMILLALINATELPIWKTLLFTLYWPSIYCLFYYLFSCNINLLKWTNKIFILLFFITLYGFYLSLFSNIFNYTNDEDQLIGVNTIYYPLLLLPWILLLKNRKYKLVLFLLLFVSVLISLKRSAAIIISVSLFLWVYYEYFFRKINKSLKLIRIVLVCGLIMLLVTIFSFDYFSIFHGMIAKFDSIAEDKGSGRLDIYGEVFYFLKNSSFLEILFGHGHNSVSLYRISNSSAHNDFLEVLFDYGLWVLILYVEIHFYLISRIKYLYQRQSFFFLPYFVSYVIFFIMSMVSHLIIYPSYFAFLVIFWAYIESLVYKKY